MNLKGNSKKRIIQCALILLLALLVSTAYPAYAADDWQYIGKAGTEPNTISQCVDNGALYVAYSEYGGISYLSHLTVKKYSDGNWTTLGPERFTDTISRNAFEPSIFVDNGTPYVAYIDDTDWKTNVTVMKFVNGSWTTVGDPLICLDPTNPDNQFANSVSLCVEDGTPYIAMTDTTYAGTTPSNKVSVMKYSDGSWQFVGQRRFSAFDLSVAAYCQPSIYVAGHVPYVAYGEYDNSDNWYLKVQEFNATSGVWQDIGDMSAIQIDDPEDPIIKVDNGDVYVAYEDNGYAKVLKCSGSSWEALGNNISDTGFTSSVAFTLANGVPYVALNGDQYYMTVKKLNGTSWDIVGTSASRYMVKNDPLTLSLVADQNTLYLACINDIDYGGINSEGAVYQYGIAGPVLINAEAPVITSQPADITVNVNDSANLSVAAVVGKGALSYEWFSNTTNSTTNGTSLGISTSSFAPPTNAAGTTYYYCVVTNTDNTATGNKTASTVSNIAKVTVSETTDTAPIDQILNKVDEAINNGTLTGNGNPDKLDAFREKLLAVKQKIESGEIRAAINQLYSIYGFVDGKPRPKDLVTGKSAAEIAQMILDLIEELKIQL
jgi:hypothetical protein